MAKDTGSLSNLPHHLTPFVGRQQDVAELTGRLADPTCRLLTLVGPGGVGKTRLALQVAGQLLDSFADGVFFVPLQPIQSGDLLPSTIADALGLGLPGHHKPQAQLLTTLRDKEILLFLDNLEHLLTPAEAPTFSLTGLLTELLRAAPGLKLLTTSREALNLQDEWLYPVRGLPYPGELSGDELEHYGAVKLFVESARRLRPDFSLADERQGVVEVCQLVEGTPLALELAASWVKTMRCAEIAAEIARNLDFLSTRLRDVPHRHRSMQAVFNQSWTLLSEIEQNVFKRLAIFRGGFRRAAAERVAGASLVTLSALVDKSLLRWEPDGRYQLHELLRQYAAEHLVQSPEDVSQIYDKHSDYYLGLLRDRTTDLQGGRQREAMLELEPELDNIRAAWLWAVEQARLEIIQPAVEGLSLFFEFRGRYTEGIQAFTPLRQRLQHEPPTKQSGPILIKLLINLSGWYIRLGQLEQAEAACLACQALYHRLEMDVLPGYFSDPRLGFGLIASIRGDYAKTAHYAELARQTSETQANPWNRQLAYYLLTRAALLQEDYETARQHSQRAYTINQETKDEWFMAYILLEMGNIAAALGDDATAQEYYQTSYDLRQEFRDPEGMAVALNHLAEIALRRNDLDEAGRIYRQSQTVYREIGDKGGLATSLTGLGRVALARGELETARQQFAGALQLAAEIQFVPLLLVLLSNIGKLFLRTARPEPGLALLSFVAHHPSSKQVVKAQAQQVLDRYQTKALPLAGLETVIATAQAGLATPIEAGLPEPEPAGPVSSTAPALVEPLTDRELEVLRLIAAGLTNREIAEQLSVVVGTVKAHNNNIYGKLGASNRVQALARARELGLL